VARRSLAARIVVVAIALSAPASAQQPEPPPPTDFPPPAPPEPPPPSEPPPPVFTPTPDEVRVPERVWMPPYVPDTSIADFIAIGAGGSLAVGMAIASPRPKHWVGGVAFDESVRNAIRMRTADGRYTVRDASDVGLSLLVTWPFLFDALFTAWYTNGNADVAKRMAIVDAEAFAIIGGVQQATTTIASRERPYARNCGTTTGPDAIPDQSVDCDGNVKYRSFFSGHSSLSFTSAGLICVHHLGLELLGSPGDAISCASAYAVASTTALFRVMGDMHYATDVLTGAAVGSLVGIGIPLLRRTHVATEPRDRGIRLQVVPVAAGLGVGGAF
jgi:membrane-associated phospholipid phosphatase